MTAVSADWVLPLDGPPIENGCVRFEDGRLVDVGPGRGDRHYDESAIVPGFVNAHSHLEYSRYAGFGDGQPFGPWIATHMARKRTLDGDGMLALARQGVADSLSSGITTTADYSFSGAAATAATELGLRAIVYLEVFAVDPAAAEEQYTRKRAVLDETELVRIGVSPHAPYSCSLDVYRWCLGLGIPVGTHLAESADENAWLEHGAGPLGASGAALVAPTGRRAVATLEPVLGPDLLCAHCVEVDAGEIALLAERRVPVAHCPRSNALLGCGIAPLADLRAAGVADRARHRLARLDSLLRRLRGDADGDLCRSRPRTPPRRPARAGCSRPRDHRGGARTANRRSGGYPDAREARRRDGRLARRKPLPPGGGSGGSRRLRRVARPSAGDDRRRQDPLPRTDGENQWREVRNTASAARRRMLKPQPR